MAKASAPKGPKKADSKQINFVTKVEGAKEVVVTGEFTGWAKDKVRLKLSGPGEWGATLDLAPGEYRYRLLVDGQWRDDAQARKRISNAYGSEDCVLVVS